MSFLTSESAFFTAGPESVPLFWGSAQEETQSAAMLGSAPHRWSEMPRCVSLHASHQPQTSIQDTSLAHRLSDLPTHRAMIRAGVGRGLTVYVA